MAEQPKYVTTADGRRITYTRWKYEETLRQQNNLANVEQVLTAQATTLANVGASMAQQEYGGYLRTIIPNLLDTYGNVNAQAAINYYDQARLEWSKAFGATASRQVTRSSVAAREKRFAAAKTQGAYRVGTMTAEEFAAKFLPTYKTLEKSEAVIGFAMKVRAKSGHEPSISAMNNALTREVASYHRDTVLFNSALDPYASRVQRVAQANACEFCKLMALGSTSGKVRVSTYAVKFHSKCHCTIQTLWEGEEPIRPDYYDQFEEEYVNAAGEGRSAKETLEQWRKNTKATVVEQPKPFKFDAAAADANVSFMNFQRRQGFSQDVFEPEALLGFREYTKGQYKEINGLLRSPEKFTAALPSEFRSNVLEYNQKNITTLDSLFDKAPPLETAAVVYRQVNGDYQTILESLKPGSTFQDLGYSSTTLNGGWNWLSGGNKLTIEIEAPAGTKGILVDGFREELTPKLIDKSTRPDRKGEYLEWEYILPRGTTFEIVEPVKDGVLKVRVQNARR